ncbi:MAG: lamin tail domain-containing protein, partial [Bacteroidetes bacterium]
IMINEVSPNNKKSGDWLEIYNNAETTVRLDNWILADSKNTFVFPETYLPAKDYLIVCADSAKFGRAFPEAYNYVGGLGFGLNKVSETIRLFNADGAAIDSMGYHDLEPTDSVFTLNLLLPWLDNGDFENWEVLPGWGTPNSANRYYVESTIQARRELWMQVGGAFSVILLCVMLLYFRQTGRL